MLFLAHVWNEIREVPPRGIDVSTVREQSPFIAKQGFGSVSAARVVVPALEFSGEGRTGPFQCCRKHSGLKAGHPVQGEGGLVCCFAQPGNQRGYPRLIVIPAIDVIWRWQTHVNNWQRPIRVGATLGGHPSDGNHIGLPLQQKDNEGL